MINKYIVAVIAVILIAVVALAVSVGGKPGSIGTSSPSTSIVSGQSASQGTIVMSLTDPPEVPPGTSALVLTYTGIKIHETGASNTTGFINVTTSGSVNLLSLTNVSQIVAVAKVPANVSFDSVIFTGASAAITISNSTFNVTVPGSQLQIKIIGTLNSSNGSLLIDLTPSVVQIYGGTNASQNVFVMVPFAKAMVLGRVSVNGHATVGARTDINASEHVKLENNSANISISSVSLSEQANSMAVSIVVKNNENSSITLKHLFLRGMLATTFNGVVGADASPGTTPGVSINAVPLSVGSSVDVGANASVHIKSSENGSTGNSSGDSGSGIGIRTDNQANASLNNTIKGDLHEGNVSAKVRAFVNGSLEFRHEMHSSLNFLISQNGTLSLPQTERQAEGQNGYLLGAGSSVKLTYYGNVTFGESNMGAQLIANQTYAVVVSGTDDAHASANATAT